MVINGRFMGLLRRWLGYGDRFSKGTQSERVICAHCYPHAVEERLSRFFARRLALIVRGGRPAAEHGCELRAAHIVRFVCGYGHLGLFFREKRARTFLGSDPDCLDVNHPVHTTHKAAQQLVRGWK